MREMSRASGNNLPQAILSSLLDFSVIIYFKSPIIILLVLFTVNNRFTLHKGNFL